MKIYPHDSTLPQLLNGAIEGDKKQKKIAAILGKAKSAYNANVFEDAIACLIEVLEVDPENSEAISLLNLARIKKADRDKKLHNILNKVQECIAQKQFLEANELIKSAKEIHERAEEIEYVTRDLRLAERESQFNSIYEKAKIALDNDDFELAILRLQEALEVIPNHPKANADLYIAQRGLKHANITKARELLVTGKLAFDEGKYNNAAQLLRQAHELDASNNEAQNKLAEVEIILSNKREEAENEEKQRKKMFNTITFITTIVLVFICVLVFLAAQGPQRLAAMIAPTPTFTPTPTYTFTPTSTPTLTLTPTETFTPTPTSTNTSTPTNTPTPTQTSTPIPFEVEILYTGVRVYANEYSNEAITFVSSPQIYYACFFSVVYDRYLITRDYCHYGAYIGWVAAGQVVDRFSGNFINLITLTPTPTQ